MGSHLQAVQATNAWVVLVVLVVPRRVVTDRLWRNSMHQGLGTIMSLCLCVDGCYGSKVRAGGGEAVRPEGG